MNYLSFLRHDRVAVIGEDFTAERAEVFKNAIAKMNQGSYRFYYSKYRTKGVVEDCVEQILCTEISPSAIVCEYDYMAIEIIQYLNKKNMLFQSIFRLWQGAIPIFQGIWIVL